MENIFLFFKGIVIGGGVILPGISGSVLAIMFGIYDKVIELIADKSKKIWYKINKLSPLLTGIIIGITIFGKILLYLYERYEIELKYIFIGLIVGSIPILSNEIKHKYNSNLKLKYFLITFVLSFFLFILNKIVLNNFYSNTSFFKLFIAGILYISGKIIPGISSSFFLIILGLYDYILLFITSPFSFSLIEYISLIPFFIGVVLGGIVLIKLINYLLNNYFVETYSAIIGFVLGSVFSLFPGFELSLKYIISFILMNITFLITYKLNIKK